MQNVPISQSGYTLLEMMIVVAVLAAIAAIAVPADSSTRHQTLELAATQLAGALQFAREESRRTGVTHGVSLDISSDQVRVFRLDETTNPNQMLFDVYQPVSKQIYTINFGAAPYRGVSLSAVGGQFVGACTEPGNVSFDRFGVVRCIDPVATRILNADVELVLAGLKRTVLVDSYTGRVSIQ